MEQLLIRQILDGDVSRFAWFIEAYKGLAWSVAYRIVKNHEDAEEVVQDSFLNAYRALGKFKGEAKFSTWFTRIVVNNALKKIRRSRLDTMVIASDDLAEIQDDAVEQAYEKLEDADRKRFVAIAIDHLEMEVGVLLTLYYLHEYSIAEISEITGIPPENIKMKLHRGRKKMYLSLEKLLSAETKTIL